MNITSPSQHDFITLKRHILLATFICYIPHIATEPWWLFLIFLSAIAYRLIADYFSYPPMPKWIRLSLIIGCLFLLNGVIFKSGLLILFLVTFIILKCLEMHTIRDLKVLILCNFFLIFSALIVVQELWIILYLLIAIIANLSVMLKLHAPEVTLKHITSTSTQQLLIAIPLSILLFYVFPRIDPLWQIASLSKGMTGFNEQMTTGSIAELYNDDSIAMQITFKKIPILDGYWRGITLSFYSGEGWYPSWYKYSNFLSLQELDANDTADYEVLLEPHQKKWLFYEGYPVAGKSSLLFSPDHGLIRQNKESITQRFVYSLKVQSAPYQSLKPSEYAEATQLPNNISPRLNAWAKQQFAKSHNDINAFIQFLHDYIHQQPFWYTLTPPTLNESSNQMDTFWFETQKGFCEHYAGAVTFILRAAGIPARVILGYQGGQWNPFAYAITIQQNNAHTWLEYWQKDIGWRKLDPTTFIAPERIDQAIRNRQMYHLHQTDYFSISTLPWQEKIKLIFGSLRIYSERWFLFYNQNSQQNLLSSVGLGKWNKGQLLQASLNSMIVFFIIVGIYYQWRQKKSLDPLLIEYHLLQKEFRRLNVSINPYTTLKQQCKLLIANVPDLDSVISSFIYRYEQLRLKQSVSDSKENKKETIALFKTLRYALRRSKPSI